MQVPITVGLSPMLGIRGVLAVRRLRAGEVVERCPLVFIDNDREAHLVEQTIFGTYWYDWTKARSCIALGFGSLYNHSYTPNTRYHRDYRNQRLVYTTLRVIEAGEELTINYNGDPANQEPIDDKYLNGTSGDQSAS
jgi:uncharacterized protein